MGREDQGVERDITTRIHCFDRDRLQAIRREIVVPEAPCDAIHSMVIDVDGRNAIIVADRPSHSQHRRLLKEPYAPPLKGLRYFDSGCGCVRVRVPVDCEHGIPRIVFLVESTDRHEVLPPHEVYKGRKFAPMEVRNQFAANLE